MRIFTLMETPAQYHLTPPVLRPLNAERLTALRRCQQGAEAYTKGETGVQSQAKQYAEDMGDLLGHAAALAARLSRAEQRADTAANYINAALKTRTQQDMTYAAEAARL